MAMPYFSSVVKKLWALTVILLIILLIVISNYGLPERKVVRCISIGILLGFFFIYNKQRYWGFLLFYIFFYLKDFGLLYYDSYGGNSFYFLLGVIGYIAFVYTIVQKKHFTLDRRGTWVSFIVLVFGGLNVFLLVQNLSIGFVENLNIPLFICYGVLSIIAALIAYQYNNIYNSRRSFWCVCAAISFMVSDLLRYIAFYLNLDLLNYFETAIYIGAWALMINLSIHPFLRQEERQAMAILEEERESSST